MPFTRGLSSFHANGFRLAFFPCRPHSLGRLGQAVCRSIPKADEAWGHTVLVGGLGRWVGTLFRLSVAVLLLDRDVNPPRTYSAVIGASLLYSFCQGVSPMRSLRPESRVIEALFLASPCGRFD